MYNQGVGEVIDHLVPGVGLRLKQILGMTDAGAHDKPAPGETDLAQAVGDLRSLREKLALVD